MKRIAIVILNWQTWQASLHCLASLRELKTPHYINIIICDNYSDNQSFTQITNWIKQHYSANHYKIYKTPYFVKECLFDCILIQTGKNLGFAGGMNIGIRYVLTQQQFDYIWLLNNDTQVEPDALNALYQCAQQDKIGLIGSSILETEQPDKIQCAGGCRYYPWLTIFKNVYAGQTRQQLPSLPDPKLDYIYGAALFLPVSVIEQIGLLNEEYFLFYEELDYCQRLKREGYKIAWCRDSFVYHQGSASIGQVKQNIRAKLQRANYYENLSTLKYTANFYPLRLPIVMLLRFGLKILVLLLRKDFDLLPALFKAYTDFIYLKLFKK